MLNWDQKVDLGYLLHFVTEIHLLFEVVGLTDQASNAAIAAAFHRITEEYLLAPEKVVVATKKGQHKYLHVQGHYVEGYVEGYLIQTPTNSPYQDGLIVAHGRLYRCPPRWAFESTPPDAMAMILRPLWDRRTTNQFFWCKYRYEVAEWLFQQLHDYLVERERLLDQEQFVALDQG